MPSMHIPIMSLWLIIELGENSPSDWSLISQRVSVPGFGTVWRGEQYIPGRRSGPKSSEYQPAATSLSICPSKKSHSVWDLIRRWELSQMSGYSLRRVCVWGQKPLHSERHTDSTAG